MKTSIPNYGFTGRARHESPERPARDPGSQVAQDPARFTRGRAQVVTGAGRFTAGALEDEGHGARLSQTGDPENTPSPTPSEMHQRRSEGTGA